MCSNVKSFEVGLLVHPAVMFMNSNKSESNIRKIIQQNRQKCSLAGIALMNETIVNKGPNRDIDRDAVNMLINHLITGQYDTVVVENMADITADESIWKNLCTMLPTLVSDFLSFLPCSTICTIQQSVLPTGKDRYGAGVSAADEDKERRHSVCRFGRTVSGKYAGRYAPRGGGQ